MRILLTGATGFVGKHVAKRLINQKYSVTALVRPGTDKKRLGHLQTFSIAYCNLTDINQLKKHLSDNEYDVMLHIGALRGGRKYNNKTFFKANVLATEILAEHALKSKCKFIFCSSVGVFGAIPLELPANNLSDRQEDTYYHRTKIEAEKIIQNLTLKGLESVIIRPAITYGAGDYGFPYTLTRLIDKKLLLLPKQDTKIHLTDIDLLTDAFINAIEIKLKPGAEFIVADHDPVSLHELSEFISQKLSQKKYPQSRFVTTTLFRLGERIATNMKNDLWQSRFQLLAYDWYYDVKESTSSLKLPIIKTIPSFNKVIYWYQNK